MNIAIFAYSHRGCAVARRIVNARGGDCFSRYAVNRLEEKDFLPLDKHIYGVEFKQSDALIFIGACGIAVREIAPFVADKRTDPAVICIDERANFVISLLSGHIGGANALAAQTARLLNATAVITTATDVNNRFSVDAWATQNGLVIESMAQAKAVSAAILEGDVPLYCEAPVKGGLPNGVIACDSGNLGIYIGVRRNALFEQTLYLTPRVLHIGVGCRRGTAKENIERAIRNVFAQHKLNVNAVCGVYSIDLKKDEEGLLNACGENGWAVRFYSSEELAGVSGEFTASKFVQSVTGVDNVCERAALFGAERLIVKKTAENGVTVAVAEEHWEVNFGEAECCGHRPGES